MARDLLANYPIYLDEGFADCFYYTTRRGFGVVLLMGACCAVYSERIFSFRWVDHTEVVILPLKHLA